MIDTVIGNNLRIARERIDQARQKSGVDEVTIVGITKTRTPAQVADLITSGCIDIGENRVQEWEEKYPQVLAELEKRNHTGEFHRHLVGHLQSNKTRRAVMDFDMIQSIDSIDLASKVGRIAMENGKSPIQCMIQVKLGEEESKSGISKENLLRDFDKFISVSGIRIVGLMLIAPLWAIGEDARSFYHEMNVLFNELKKQSDSRFDMKFLSMGMSADFDIAVEEGSNMVRIGRALFEGFENL